MKGREQSANCLVAWPDHLKAIKDYVGLLLSSGVHRMAAATWMNNLPLVLMNET